jgi:hypothetical protein
MPVLLNDAIAVLFEAMNELVPRTVFPKHVLPIPACIGGTAFFPGGRGVYLEGRDPASVNFPVGGVMVLGHNFDSEAAFWVSFQEGGRSKSNKTWSQLLRLLKACSVPVEKCFFTNAFMGLCEGDDNQNFRGRGDASFRNACLAFLKTQIEIQRPRMILTLGLRSPPLLACTCLNLQGWKGRPKSSGADRTLTLQDLNAAPIAFDVKFEFGDGSSHAAVAAALAHPSQAINGRNRTISGFTGENDLIRTAWIAASR